MLYLKYLLFRKVMIQETTNLKNNLNLEEYQLSKTKYFLEVIISITSRKVMNYLDAKLNYSNELENRMQ